MKTIHVAGIDVDGSALALTDGAVTHTWSQLLGEAVRAGNAMRTATAGARVAVVGTNSASTLVAHLAAALAGVSSVGINARLAPEEIAYILRDSGSALCVVPAERLGDVGDVAGDAGCRVVITGAPDQEENSWARLVAEGAPEWVEDNAPEPLVLYTSGTSGFPKGTHARWVADPGPTTATYLSGVRDANSAVPTGPHLVSGPLHHNGPLMGLRSLIMGNPVVILPKFSGEAALEAIERFGIVSTVMVPTHLIRMLAVADETRAAANVSTMKHLVLTGAACPREVKEAIIAWMGPIVSEAYGGTESGTVCTISSEEWLRHPTSVGRPLPRFEALVIDDAGEEVRPGAVGRLFFRDTLGHGVRYLGDPDKTAAAHLRPGVFTLGDVGFVDADGYVHVTDRAVDMVLSGGVNIYPAEIERVLDTHPAVSEVAVIGVPDPEMGERLLGLVVPADPGEPPAAAELESFCRRHLAGYKCPRVFEIVTTLNRDHMGKINKKRLRARYADATSTGQLPPGSRK